MQVSFKSGFIYLPTSGRYINPQNVSQVFKRDDDFTSIHLNEGDYVITSAPVSEVVAACLKAQAQNDIIEIKHYF